MLVGQLALTGCVSLPASTTTSSDVRVLRAQLEVPEWLGKLDDRAIDQLVTEALETPVDFYGRVVDRDGKPISDVGVELALFDHRLDPFVFPYVGWTALSPIKTDAEGRFALESVTGTDLYVRVFKPGWKSVGNSKRHVRYAEVDRYLNEYPIPTEAEPMTFVMTPGLPLDDYYRFNSGAVLLPRDGSEIGYRLDRPNPYGVAPEEGDLAVGCKKGAMTESGTWDWSCRLRMLNGGGVQLRRDLVLQQAPTDGYREVFEFGMSAEAAEWDHRAERYLYVRLRDGRYYGHLGLRVRTAGDFFFAVDGMVNTAGTRELESLLPEGG